MASYTPNYNLKKPAGTDVVDIDDLNGNMDIIDTQLDSLNSNIASMGTFETIDANITADKTISHDFTKYRYVVIYYLNAAFYRQFVMYPQNIVTGSGKWGYDNLLTDERCYCLKTSTSSLTSIEVSVTIPASGIWSGGHFEMYGIK